MELIEEILDNSYGRARMSTWKTKTGKSMKTPQFIPKISHKKSFSRIDAELLCVSQWVDTIAVDLPFIHRWESLPTEKKRKLQQSKTILLDLRTDKLTKGQKEFLDGFLDLFLEKVLNKESDAIKYISKRIKNYYEKKDKHLVEADFTPTFIDNFIEMIIKRDEYDIVTAPYFQMKSNSPLSEIINLNKECITTTIKKMNQLGIEKDIMGVICISQGLLQNKGLWSFLFELLDMDVGIWGIRMSPLNVETENLPVLWEFIDDIIPKIGEKLLLGLDFELINGPFGFPLLAIGLDAFSSGICETDEYRRKENPSRVKPFGFYYLRRKRLKKHIKEVLPNDIQECDCPVCKELITGFFNEFLDVTTLQARLKEMESIKLKSNMKRHFLYCRGKEITEYEEKIKYKDFFVAIKDIARNSAHSDWENALNQRG